MNILNPNYSLFAIQQITKELEKIICLKVKENKKFKDSIKVSKQLNRRVLIQKLIFKGLV